MSTIFWTLVYLCLGAFSAKLMFPYCLSKGERIFITLVCLLTGPLYLLFSHPDYDNHDRCEYCGANTIRLIRGNVEIKTWIHKDCCICAVINDSAIDFLNTGEFPFEKKNNDS